MSAKLPAWPDSPHISLIGDQWTQSELIEMVAHYSALADAAMARLRVAVGALSEIEFEARSADMDNDCADEVHAIVMDALADIGDLPSTLPPIPPQTEERG